MSDRLLSFRIAGLRPQKEEVTNPQTFMITISLRAAVTVLLLTVIAGCTPYFRYHDQLKAGEVAQRFAEAALVRRDFDSATTLLGDDSTLNPTESGNKINSLHGEGPFPKSVLATHYEIKPNSGIIWVYLEGPNQAGKKNYYRIVLSPDSKNEYGVREVFLSEIDVPYPDSPSRLPL